jgi:hypothetical protein
MQKPLVSLVMLLGLTACSRTPPEDLVAVRDSAGVSIVTNTTTQLASVSNWELGVEPVLEISPSGSSEYVLYSVTKVLPHPDAGLVVLNSAAFEVLVLDLDGRLLTRIGGEGDGPGEFRRPSSLFLVPPDSLAVYDSQHRRLSFFDRNGTLGREITLGSRGEGSVGERILPLETGGFAVATWPGLGEGSREGPYRPESEYYRIDGDGSEQASYGMVPGSEVFANRTAAGGVFFGPTTHATTSGNLLVVGTSEKAELRVYSPDGNLASLIRWPDRDRTLSQERINSFIEFALSTVEESVRPQTRDLLSAIPMSEEVPAYGALLASEEETIWVGPHQGPEVTNFDMPPAAGRWLLFRSDGILVATVEAPEGFEPLSIRGDQVFGVFVNEMGVESVRVYGIKKE